MGLSRQALQIFRQLRFESAQWLENGDRFATGRSVFLAAHDPPDQALADKGQRQTQGADKGEYLNKKV